MTELQNILDQVTVVADIQDRVRWSFHNSGCFSVTAFPLSYYKAERQLLLYDTSVSRVWRGLCPSKAELLLRLLLLGRINTKVRFQRLNILRNKDIRCVFCGLYDENMSHLFFTCNFAWRVWSYCCNWWNLDWVISEVPNINFDSWNAVGLRGAQKKAWQLCIYAIVWSIWDARNKVVFQSANICWERFMIELMYRCREWISLMHRR